MSSLQNNCTWYILSFIMFFIYSKITVAQQSSNARVDSLKQALLTAPPEEGIEILLDLAVLSFNHHPEESMAYAEDAAALSRKNKLRPQEGRSVYLTARIYEEAGEYSSAHKHYGESTKIFKNDNHIRGFISAGFADANLYYKQSSIDSALQKTSFVLANIDNSENIPLIAELWALSAKCHDHQGNYETAIESYGKAIESFKDNNSNPLRIAEMTNRIGIILRKQGNYSEAIEQLYQSIKIYTDLNDSIKIISNFINIANINYSSGKPDEALKAYLLASEMNERIGDQEIQAALYNNIGSCYLTAAQDPKKALEYFRLALKVSEETGSQESMALSHQNNGNAYLRLEDYDNAEIHHEKALAIRKDMNDVNGLALSYNNLGVLNALQKDFAASEEYFLLSIEISKQLNSKQYILDNYWTLSDMKKDAKDYESALEYYQLYTAYKDSIHNEKNSEQLARLQTEYETDRKEKEIELLSKDKVLQDLELGKKEALILAQNLDAEKNAQSADLLNKANEILSLSVDKKIEQLTIKKLELENQQAKLDLAEVEKTARNAELAQEKSSKKLILSGSVFTLFAGMGIFSFFYYRKRSNFKQRQVSSELKALRAQINPHFLFNALGSIHNFVLQNNNQNASDYLIKFSKLMRLVLNNSMEEYVPLEKELESLSLYMELESARLNKKFTYELDIDNSLDTENLMIPPMLIQPFVENSIWHGIQNKEGNGLITIKFSYKDRILHCMVEDDGIGREKAALVTKKMATNQSSGIKLTRERLDIFLKKNKSKGEVLFTDLKQGLRVAIDIPVVERF